MSDEHAHTSPDCKGGVLLDPTPPLRSGLVDEGLKGLFEEEEKHDNTHGLAT